VVVLGGGGNVGGYAVQLAQLAGARVVATARPRDFDLLRSWGVADIVAARNLPPPELAAQADVVIDTVGGAALAEGFACLRRGGVLISAVAEPDQSAARRHEDRAQYVLVAETTAALSRLTELIDAGKLSVQIGETLRLSEAPLAHKLLEGGKRRLGKIVLVP
jgi:NADPH:quinone reductase-like Zn-dependent oxidoreductase